MRTPPLPVAAAAAPRRAPRGLTLIELMMALAVLAVLGALVVPSFGARAQRARLHGTAQMLATDVAQARFEAARRGQPLYLQSAGAGVGGGWCWAIATAPGCPCGQQQACELSHVASSDHPGVTLADALDLRFDADGNAGGRAAVRLASRDERLRVEVSPLGRARICSETGASGPGMPPC